MALFFNRSNSFVELRNLNFYTFFVNSIANPKRISFNLRAFLRRIVPAQRQPGQQQRPIQIPQLALLLQTKLALRVGQRPQDQALLQQPGQLSLQPESKQAHDDEPKHAAQKRQRPNRHEPAAVAHSRHDSRGQTKPAHNHKARPARLRLHAQRHQGLLRRLGLLHDPAFSHKSGSAWARLRRWLKSKRSDNARQRRSRLWEDAPRNCQMHHVECKQHAQFAHHTAERLEYKEWGAAAISVQK